MKKIVIGICIGLLFLPWFSIHAEELKLAEQAQAAILIEASTGEILFEKNSHERREPASMTKMMSMLLIIESIEKGIISWDEMVTVSENASSMGGSQILLETNEQMSVRDLFKGIAVASGNDAVVAMAEKIAGSESGFVDMMNQKAKDLGLTNTNFKNPHGLSAADHYSSAYDMAIIAKELVKHPQVLEYTSIYEDYLRENTDRKIWLVNTNKLVRFYSGVDGLKTGFTDAAGYCLTATAKRDHLRLIAVVMGAETSKIRNQEISELLDYAFAQYKIDQLLTTKSDLGKIAVSKGKEKYVQLYPMEDINLLSKKIDGQKNYSYDLDISSVTAPIHIGDMVGKIIVKENENVIREVGVTVGKDIEKANIFELYWSHLTDILAGNMNF